MELRCVGRCCLVNRCLLVSADYSQIEMRVLAHLCRDPVLLDLFRHEQDYDHQPAGLCGDCGGARQGESGVPR
jgi:hypothetical protein